MPKQITNEALAAIAQREFLSVNDKLDRVVSTLTVIADSLKLIHEELRELRFSDVKARLDRIEKKVGLV